jgi:hypothetical protein
MKGWLKYGLAIGVIVTMVAVCRPGHNLFTEKGTAIGQYVQTKYNYVKPFFMTYSNTSCQMFLGLVSCFVSIHSYYTKHPGDDTSSWQALNSGWKACFWLICQ